MRGLCNGDPGGPLLVTKSSPQNDIIVGVGSATLCPKQQGYPDVFAKVSYFAKWIDEQICTNSKYKPATCPKKAPTASLTKSPTASPTKAPTRQVRAAGAKPTAKPATGKL